MLLFKVYMPSKAYKDATIAWQGSRYDDALEGFLQLGEYKDAEQQALLVADEWGLVLLREENLKEAVALFTRGSGLTSQQEGFGQRLAEALAGFNEVNLSRLALILSREEELEPQQLDTFWFAIGQQYTRQNTTKGYALALGVFEKMDSASHSLHENARSLLYDGMAQVAQNMEKVKDKYCFAVLGSDYMAGYRDATELAVQFQTAVAQMYYDAGEFVEAYRAADRIRRGISPAVTAIKRDSVAMAYQTAIVESYPDISSWILDDSMFDKHENIEYYRALVADATIHDDSPDSEWKPVYEALREMGDFEDAQQRLAAEKYMFLRLRNTTWRSGDHYFKMNYSAGRYTCEYYLYASSIPRDGADYFRIKGNVYQLTYDNEETWQNILRITLLDDRTMQLYAYRDGTTYTLYK